MEGKDKYFSHSSFLEKLKKKKNLYSFMQNETENLGIVAAERATPYVSDYLHGCSCNRKGN